MVLNVTKRNGEIVPFESSKIVKAIGKATDAVGENLTDDQKTAIAVRIKNKETETLAVEEIQDIVERLLMESGVYEVAKAYIRYRYERELARKENTTDKTIQELLDGQNLYWNTENSNKDAQVNNVQRDYLAGIVSTDTARRILLPKEIVEAHDKGLIHIHDLDYFSQK